MVRVFLNRYLVSPGTQITDLRRTRIMCCPFRSRTVCTCIPYCDPWLYETDYG
ncbi:Protein of unknown function [Pyronema omphalodes CBS 100304]|uniref:Uncharacterized protein n=1 Tax=Pyronema omphalodes (strain CBS 100304) TaxID=1076935 RepID=U4LKF3_PYROM|nr:Protein of unknown function [Pyronema omphalodes CBS 100304]